MDLSIKNDYKIFHAQPYNDTLSLSLDAGKYIVLFDEDYSGGTQTYGYQYVGQSDFRISSTNGECELINNKLIVSIITYLM